MNSSSPVGLHSPHNLEKIPRFHVSVQSKAFIRGSVSDIGQHKNVGNLLKADSCEGFPFSCSPSCCQGMERSSAHSWIRTPARSCRGRKNRGEKLINTDRVGEELPGDVMLE